MSTGSGLGYHLFFVTVAMYRTSGILANIKILIYCNLNVIIMYAKYVVASMM